MNGHIILFWVVFICFGSAALYEKFGLFKMFYHNICGWHIPIDEKEFDGCNIHSHCKYCGKEIIQDLHGNWFLKEGRIK